MTFNYTLSATDVVGKAFDALASGIQKDTLDASKRLFSHPNALALVRSRITHDNAPDVDMISRLIYSNCVAIRETILADRPPLWFLDFFRKNGLVTPLRMGDVGVVHRAMDFTDSEVNYIGDNSEDWPNVGGNQVSASLNATKPFGVSVSYGILEFEEAALQGRDIFEERYKNALHSMDRFKDEAIAKGHPNHGMYGIINHPSIPTSIVAATAGPNAPSTQWPLKAPNEVLTDLQAARDISFADAMYNTVADTLILAANRDSLLNMAQLSPSGFPIPAILEMWNRSQSTKGISGLTDIVSYYGFNTAGPATVSSPKGTPIMLSGSFKKDNIEFPLAQDQQTPVQFYNAKWTVGLYGKHASVMPNRPNRFRVYTGI